MSTSLQSGRSKAAIWGTAGVRIGKFKLIDVIGAGGFGEVWKAQEEIEGQPVGPPCAVKLMHLAARQAGSSGQESLKAGWIQEINALKSITHDAIPRTIDGGIDEGTGLAFIAMELLEGETLAQRISRKRLGWRRTLVIAECIASALDAAHAHDVVHRDLKPQNVFLRSNGRVCVIDWGIAKLGVGPDIATELPARRDTKDSSDTGTQDFSTEEQRNVALQNRPVVPRIVGTPGYIAPEVYEGANPTAPVDAYALGVVLYQCMTGRLPHRMDHTAATTGSGASAADAARAYLVDVWKATAEGNMSDLQEFASEIPLGVRALVERLLSRSPEERGAGELASAIAHANLFPSGVPDPPYVGLDPFGADRAGFLFGRDGHVDRIMKRLARDRVVVLSGPSGCGKSSLAVAGVASRIDRDLLEGTDGWRLLVVRPSEPHVLQTAAPADMAGSQDAPLGTVVVVDQLEEVLGLAGEVQASFCRALAALAERSDDVIVHGQRMTRDAPMRLIATVREDFEWQVVRIEFLRQLCETSRFLVTGVDATSARELVEEPAKALGYRLEAGDKVIREVETLLATDPTALPIVQFALSEWWVRRDTKKKELPAKAWRDFGGVDGALSHVADRHYRGLSEADQLALRDLFGRLLLGDRKQWVSVASLGNDQERHLMDQLADLRLVRRRDDRDGLVGYELAHESLARRWDVLKQWISERAAEDAQIADLEIEAKLWMRQQRPANRLRPDLAVTPAVRKRLGSDALQYADASIEAGRAAKIAEQAARRRQYVITVGVLLTVVVIAVVYALQIRSKEKETQNALEQVQHEKSVAEKLRTKAENAQLEADAAKEKAQADDAKHKKDLDDLEQKIAKAKDAKELEELRQEVAKRRGFAVPPPAPSPPPVFEDRRIINIKDPPTVEPP
jgi:serine/threonine protein kinase